jgi:hypothetical protein
MATVIGKAGIGANGARSCAIVRILLYRGQGIGRRILLHPVDQSVQHPVYGRLRRIPSSAMADTGEKEQAESGLEFRIGKPHLACHGIEIVDGALGKNP